MREREAAHLYINIHATVLSALCISGLPAQARNFPESVLGVGVAIFQRYFFGMLLVWNRFYAVRKCISYLITVCVQGYELLGLIVNYLFKDGLLREDILDILSVCIRIYIILLYNTHMKIPLLLIRTFFISFHLVDYSFEYAHSSFTIFTSYISPFNLDRSRILIYHCVKVYQHWYS